MKIEKINENQIRCTLTHNDLMSRKIKLSELAYGTEKVKSLFRDMMQQASSEFGFEADDIPLMIEAIPSSSDSIVLIITKVEDPDELNTRFSKFAPAPQQGNAENPKYSNIDKLVGADDFLALLDKVKESVSKPNEAKDQPSSEPEKPIIRVFSFATIDSVIHAAKLLSPMYNGNNSLYKDAIEDIYLLVLSPETNSTADFNKFCNMLSEYGSLEKVSPSTLAYLEEHGERIIQTNAMEQLEKL